MRIGIKYRLFLALLSATGLVALGMLLIMQWSIDRGFLQYVNTLDEERLGRLAAELERTYAAEGSWDALRGDPRQLLRLMLRTLPEGQVAPEHLERLERRLEHRQRRRPLPPELLLPPGLAGRFELRVQLFDADRRLLLGPAEGPQPRKLQPLRRDGKVVGYLGLQPQKDLSDVQQMRFVKEQKLALLLIAGLMLAVSAVLALPLANRLVRPLQALAAATRRLAAGNYGERVPVAGRDELGQLAGDFNALALTLERTETDRRQWLADISHELRTPLAVLRGEIEALQDGVRPLTQAALASLHGEVLQLGRLVDDLYQLSLSDLGALQYRKEEVPLGAVLVAALDAVRPSFAGRGIVLSATLSPGAELHVFADPQRLHQLFAALLDNSLKYTAPPGRLDVRLQRRGTEACIEFSDSAPGVPAEVQPRLFDRFFRVDPARRRATGGAGLGLAICRNIVEAHGGTIDSATSTLGGLRIDITLPLTEGRDE